MPMAIMSGMSHHRVLLLSSALVCSILSAQQRQPVTGRVLDAAGAPAAGAVVTLVWSPPGGEACGPPDVVTATADATGHFAAAVLAQQTYSLWAVQAAADGRAHASSVTEQVGGGADLQVRLWREIRPRTLRLEATEPYADQGPLRLQVAPGAANLALFDVSGSGEAPVLPSIALAVVRDRQGAVVAARSVPPDTGEPFVFALPEPVRYRLRALGLDHQPVADATVFYASASSSAAPPLQSWRACGTTDPSGDAAIRAPIGSILLIRAAGMAERFFTANPLRSTVVELQPAARLEVQPADALPPEAQVLLTASYVDPDCERSVALRLVSGTAELPLPLHPVAATLHIRANAAAPWHRQGVELRSGETVVVRPDRQRRLSLQFVDQHGDGARALPGVLVAIGSACAERQQIPICTDASGRLECTLGSDAWLLFVTDGVQWARYDVPAQATAAATELRATLHCAPLPVATLHVFDAANQRPVARATLAAATVPGDQPLPTEASRSAELFARLMQALVPRLLPGAASDQDGRLVVRVPPLEGCTWHLQLSAPGHGTTGVGIEAGMERVALLPDRTWFEK